MKGRHGIEISKRQIQNTADADNKNAENVGNNRAFSHQFLSFLLMQCYVGEVFCLFCSRLSRSQNYLSTWVMVLKNKY